MRFVLSVCLMWSVLLGTERPRVWRWELGDPYLDVDVTVFTWANKLSVVSCLVCSADADSVTIRFEQLRWANSLVSSSDLDHCFAPCSGFRKTLRRKVEVFFSQCIGFGTFLDCSAMSAAAGFGSFCDLCEYMLCNSGPELFPIAYHLWVPYYHHVPPFSRKTQSTKYHSIKSLENQNWHICDMKILAVKNDNGHFSGLTGEVHKNAGIYYKIPISENKMYSFCVKNRRVSRTTLKAFAYRQWYAYHSLGSTALQLRYMNACVTTKTCECMSYKQ